MSLQTLKRQAGDAILSNDNLDDDDCDVTCVNKKSRYLYNTLQSPDLFSNINDSDQAESINSNQPTTEQLNFSSDTSSCEFDSDCDSQSSSHYDNTEFELTEKDIILSIDKGYSLEDSDVQITTPSIHVLSSGCFTTCVQCRKRNPNPQFQYCYKCFRYRKQLIDSKPDPKPKNIKRLFNMSNYMEDNSSHRISSRSSNSQESVSIGISDLCLSKENTTDVLENPSNKCNICFLKPKNGIFNHGDTGHVYSCYKCAKHIWGKTGRCPICNVKVKYVTKAVFF